LVALNRSKETFQAMSPIDTRRVVGSYVHAKALHVTNKAECARRYGSKAKSKMLLGTVVGTTSTATSSGRTSTSVLCDFILAGDVTKRAELNIRSVRSGRIPATTVVAEVDVPSAVPTAVNLGASGGTGGTIPATSAMRTTTEQISQGLDEMTELATDVQQALDTFVREQAEQAETPTRALENPTDPSATETEASLKDLEEYSVNSVSPRIPAIIPAVVAAPAAVPRTPPPPIIPPVTTAHDVAWYADHRGSTKLPIKGDVPPRSWAVRTSVGDMLGPGSDVGRHRSRLEYFLLMFPPQQLNEMVRLTNLNLHKKKKRLTTIGETIKLFGVLILSTRFEFGTRASLWSINPSSKYRPAPAFGRTGMPRHRFDELWGCLAFSEQPQTRPDTMSSEQYRWLLVDGFVDKFNEYRKNYFVPSHTICVDESISRWYGQGGFWINIGLPMYMAIDRKPENGCEIQNAACGTSGVMLRLKLVKTAEEEGANAVEGDDGLLHGTVVLKSLVLPWAMTNRIVCGDSYFASVGACEEMERIGLRFIGVVKTATRRFPLAYLSALELVQRGDRFGLTANGPDGSPSMLAFVWMDRNRRYFISNCSSLQEGAPYSRIRWRQVDTTANADATRVELTIPQPIACEIYYDTCAQIDRHNRMRQDDLMLERKLGTMDWSLRVNLSIFGMCVVDSWLMYSKCTETEEKQREFYEMLAEEMIDNTHDQVRGRRSENTGDGGIIAADGHMRSGISAHLTPTKRKRRKREAVEGETGNQMRLTNTSYMQQGRCIVCSKKSTQVCSQCQDENDDENNTHEAWICKPTTFRTCFATHLNTTHSL
jgi:hypothetical protein